jgi:cobalt/nickel transport system permease protein
MHIPDGLVRGELNAAMFVVAAGCCAVALHRAKHTLGDRQAPLLGVTAAFVFAAQMLNFPVAGGTSGHFLGALMAALLLGPLNACLVLAVVLLIQCLLFADGGLTALGANVFNMGIVAGIGGYWVHRAVRVVLPATRTGYLAATAVAAWASVVMASAACAVALVWSGHATYALALPTMVGIHALIGIGEALITTMVMATVTATRPDLVADLPAAPCRLQEVSP